MASIIICFHGDLKIFLTEDSENRCISVDIKGHETIKHLIESLGVPHTEVDVILTNGASVNFEWRPIYGDTIDVFPKMDNWTNQIIQRLQPEFKEKPKFVLDGHLGKLADYLRLLGFDTNYHNDITDDKLAEISSTENRILLTRDRGLLKRSVVKYGYFVRSTEPKNQVVELFRKFSLSKFADPFTRCVKCNGLLRPISKEKVYDRLEPRTKRYYNDFQICSECDQIYWKGSHFNKMEKFVYNLLAKY